MSDYNKAVGEIMEAELINLGLLDKLKVAQQDKDNPLYKNTSCMALHFLGIDVHDIGNRLRTNGNRKCIYLSPVLYSRRKTLAFA